MQLLDPLHRFKAAAVFVAALTLNLFRHVYCTIEPGDKTRSPASNSCPFAFCFGVPEQNVKTL
jgi:hypothetical protein